MRLSGAWSTSIARGRILVSWEKLPQEHKHNKNKGNVNLPCASQHHSFSQCSPQLLQYCYQFLSSHSWLWNLQFPFTTANKGETLLLAFCIVSGQRHFLQIWISPNQKKEEESQLAGMQSTRRLMHMLRSTPRICPANTQRRKHMLVLGEMYQAKVLMCCLATQSCLTHWNSMDCSRQALLSMEIFQAGILEWVAISSSRGSSWHRDRTHIFCISCTDRQILYHWPIWDSHQVYRFPKMKTLVF